MAFKLAVVAFFSLVLLAQAGARLVHDDGELGWPGPAAAATAPLGGDAAATVANAAAPRQQHIGWNAGVWLLGLGLVAFGRQGQPRALGGGWRLAKLGGPAAR